jgi:hypothetical protein
VADGGARAAVRKTPNHRVFGRSTGDTWFEAITNGTFAGWHQIGGSDTSCSRAAAEREVGVVKTRLWLMYLAGVLIGFDRARLGVFQTLASKRRRGAAHAPLSRADLYR